MNNHFSLSGKESQGFRVLSATESKSKTHDISADQAALIIGIAVIAIVAVLVTTSSSNTDNFLEQFYSSARNAFGQFFSPSGANNPQSPLSPKIGEIKLGCGSVVLKSGFLASDIICKNTSDIGISFGADSITLDCNNHKIIGLDKNSYGIYLKDRKNIVIKNCGVENFQYGAYVLRSTGITFENVKTKNNDMGFVLWKSDSNTFSAITSTENRRGFFLQTSSKNTIRSAIIEKNEQYGIFSLDSDPISLTESRICGNPTYDIYISPMGSAGKTGSTNVCDMTYHWKETGIDGCAKKC